MAAKGARPARGAARAPSRQVVQSARTVSSARRGFARARDDRERSQLADIQRSRLIAAVAVTVDRHGYDGASVARITERARVSRRTFYELFDNREQCVLAAFDAAVERVVVELGGAELAVLSWRERVRLGLWRILCLFDSEPALARLCVVHSQRGDVDLLSRRQQLLDRLAMEVDAGREESPRGAKPGVLTGQAVVGGVLCILHASLSDPAQDSGSLHELFGELTATILLPYLGPDVAGRERRRKPPGPPPPAISLRAERLGMEERSDSLAGLPMRLTYRTARVLRDVAEFPGSSNRQIAVRVGIADQGQVSKLLSRLQRIGLLINASRDAAARGDANAWRLTDNGTQVAKEIAAHSFTTQSSNPACTATDAGTPNSREGSNR